MASASKYTWTRTNGTTGRGWRAVWTGKDGRKKFKRGFDRESDALEYGTDRESEIRHGITLAGERPTSRTTVEAWAATWLAGVDVRPSTREAYGHVIKRVNAGLGGRSLGGLRPSEIRSWRQGLTRTYAEATADNTASILAMMLRAAVEDGLLDKSPMPRMKGGSTAKGRIVDPTELLTLEQVQAWDAKLPAHARGMAVVAAQTGVRQGELLGLQAGDVDFLRREIRVRQQLVTLGGKAVYGAPKTEAGIRTVPLPEIAAEALAAHLAAFPTAPGEPMFRTMRGNRWLRSHFRDCWNKARKDAGLPDWSHWHALRDVAASSLIHSGESVKNVMVILGHASSEETLRTYSRLWPSDRDNARKALDRIWSADSGSHGVATEQ